MARYAHLVKDPSCCPVGQAFSRGPKSIHTEIYPSQLLTMEEKDPKRLFEGNALIRRLVRVGVLDESRMKLDYVLALKVEDFLERRLQTCVYKLGLAKSIHHARVLIKQRHIRFELTSPNLVRSTNNLRHAASASKSSMCPLSSYVLIRKSTSTSLSRHRSAEDALGGSGERRLRLRRRRMTVMAVMKTKSRQLQPCSRTKAGDRGSSSSWT